MGATPADARGALVRDATARVQAELDVRLREVLGACCLPCVLVCVCVCMYMCEGVCWCAVCAMTHTPPHLPPRRHSPAGMDKAWDQQRALEQRARAREEAEVALEGLERQMEEALSRARESSVVLQSWLEHHDGAEAEVDPDQVLVPTDAQSEQCDALLAACAVPADSAAHPPDAPSLFSSRSLLQAAGAGPPHRGHRRRVLPPRARAGQRARGPGRHAEGAI